MINSNTGYIKAENIETHDDKFENEKAKQEWNDSNYDSKSIITLEEFELDAKHSVTVTPYFLR